LTCCPSIDSTITTTLKASPILPSKQAQLRTSCLRPQIVLSCPGHICHHFFSPSRRSILNYKPVIIHSKHQEDIGRPRGALGLPSPATQTTQHMIPIYSPTTISR
jgi:hypothetical protein